MKHRIFILIALFIVPSVFGQWAEPDSSTRDYRSRYNYQPPPTEPRYTNNSNNTSPQLEARLQSMEQQLSSLAFCYSKVKDALEFIAKKLAEQPLPQQSVVQEPSQTLPLLQNLSLKLANIETTLNGLPGALESTSSPSTASESPAINREALILLQTISDKLADVETSISLMPQAAALQETEPDSLDVTNQEAPRLDEVLNVLDQLAQKLGNMDASIQYLLEQPAPPSADGTSAKLDPEVKALLQSLSLKLASIETSLQDIPAASRGDGEFLQEISQKLDDLENSLSNMPAPAPNPEVIQKLSSIESSLENLSLAADPAIIQKLNSIEDSLKTFSPGTDSGSLDPAVLQKLDDIEASLQTLSLSAPDNPVLLEKLTTIETTLQNMPAAGIPSEPLSYISIMGAVNSPGKVPVEEGGKKDILTALAYVGGLTEDGNPRAITVRRNQKVFMVDITRIMSDDLVSFELQSGDIVIVKNGTPTVSTKPNSSAIQEQTIPDPANLEIQEENIEKLNVDF